MSTLAEVIQRGVIGSRPTAGVAGRLYFDTTNSILYRDSGTVWESVEASSVAAPGFVKLGETVCVGDTPIITFSAISGSYTHLMMMFYGRSKVVANYDSAVMRFNGDTGANYDFEILYGGTTVAGAAQTLAGANAQIGYFTGSSATAGVADGGTVWIYNYAGTTFQKVWNSVRGLKYGVASGNIQAATHSGWWRSAAAITQIEVFSATADMLAGTVVSLYGLT